MDDGKNAPPSISQDYLPEIARPSFPKVNFGVLTGFRYNVNWETDGRSPDQAAFARRVPSAARSLHGRRVSVEGYMIPVTLIENDSKTTEFLLLPDTKACCEGKTPEAKRVDSREDPAERRKARIRQTLACHRRIYCPRKMEPF